MADFQPLTPPAIQKLLKRYDTEDRRKQDRQRKRRAQSLVEALARKDQKAVDRIIGKISPQRVEEIQATGMRKPAAKTIARIEAEAEVKRSYVNRSPAMTELRQRKMVEMLTSGGRCSLARAWKLAGYGKHNPSLASFLASPRILELFKQALDAGRSLPSGFNQSRRILRALGLPPDYLDYRNEDISDLL